jgi:hypothetical protein
MAIHTLDTKQLSKKMRKLPVCWHRNTFNRDGPYEGTAAWVGMEETEMHIVMLTVLA